MRYLPLLLLISLLFACNKDDDPIDPSGSGSPNILLIIADDMGKDATMGFTEGSIKPNTPNLDKLKNEGLTFTNLWVTPTCSPTRAAIITGKYGYRTGVKWANDELSPTEKILHQTIKEESNDAYATALVGKWHLSGDSASLNPETFGMDYYAGLLRGGVQNYNQSQLTEGGVASRQTEYITQVITDLSIDWVNSQAQPWFLWMAYNAPHTPFHVPPSEMHSQGTLPEYSNGMDPMPYYMAAIEAMDFQIGRIFTEISEDELDNTLIIFLGDNGTPGQVAQPPYGTTTAKGSLYQGGINVPMFVWGKGLSRTGEDNSLLCATDLFSTIAELAGAEMPAIHDSKSFKDILSSPASHRSFQYSERDDGINDSWAISDGSYKLIVNANGSQEMYYLENDPYEENELLSGSLTNEQADAKAALEEELSNIRQ